MEFANTSSTWPDIDPVAQPYFDGMKNSKVLIQCCTHCNTMLAPGQLLCDECGSFKLEWTESKGQGEIYTFVTFHRCFHPAFESMLPYSIALVELNEGPRLMAHLIEFNDHPPVIGQPVLACFKSFKNQNQLLCFKPN